MATEFNVQTVLEDLSIKEKVALLSLRDNWHLTPIERFNIPAIRLSDGPNGVRGTKFFRSIPAACFSCGTGLGSTWNNELLEEAGHLMSVEARHKGAHCILGPTCNIQRGPLGGRGFESFSEDPILSGFASASIIKGIEKGGVATAIKHYVCNDSEDDRHSVSAIISERALREVYLMPFQLAIKYADPKSIMTSYNKVNGVHVSQDEFLLTQILRDEWKWKGMTMSDWYGCYSIKDALLAGLDLECPGGPTLLRKHDSLMHQILAREIPMSVIDERCTRILEFIKFCTESGIPQDGAEDDSNNTPETSALVRKVAGEAIVLLKNENKLLPLSKEDNIAIIGPGAKAFRTGGGGSASLKPYYQTTVYDSLVQKLGKEPTYALGSDVEFSFFDFGSLVTSTKGAGFNIKVFNGPVDAKDRTLIEEMNLETSKLLLFDYAPEGMDDGVFYMDIEGDYVAKKTEEVALKESCLGTALVYINDELFIDDKTKQEAGYGIIGVTSKGYIKNYKFEAGKTYKIRIEYSSAKTFTASEAGALTSSNGSGLLFFGYNQTKTADELIAEAVETAKAADKVVVCIGTSYDYETEGKDRDHMDLPGNQVELVSEILKVNKNVIVVNQSGTPVTLPFMEEVPAFIQSWFNGMEAGNAVVDVLYGDVNPSGKLSLTFPKRNEDNPAFLTFKSNKGECVYGEDVFVGWRYYEKTKTEPLFPFGYGLSYTSFEFSDLEVKLVKDKLVVTLKITNTGDHTGKEVAQLYVVPPSTTTSIDRPVKELKAFTKVELKPKETKAVTIETPYNFASSYFDADAKKWHAEAGDYGVLVGNSSNSSNFLKGGYTLAKDEFWLGL